MVRCAFARFRMSQKCYAPDAFLKVKMHLGTPRGAYYAPPE